MHHRRYRLAFVGDDKAVVRIGLELLTLRRHAVDVQLYKSRLVSSLPACEVEFVDVPINGERLKSMPYAIRFVGSTGSFDQGFVIRAAHTIWPEIIGTESRNA